MLFRSIPVAFVTPRPDQRTFWGFTLIGLYVGVIPVFLGIFWFPALRQLGRRTMTFLMAATAGLLIFLGVDTLAEALETRERAFLRSGVEQLLFDATRKRTELTLDGKPLRFGELAVARESHETAKPRQSAHAAAE